MTSKTTAAAGERNHPADADNDVVSSVGTDIGTPRALTGSLPDGTTLDAYSGHENWTSRRWAWEFLRRNETFIQACDEIAEMPDSDRTEARRLVALLFGLDRFKPYSEDYSVGKPPKFESSGIYVLSNMDQDEPKEVPITALAKGEVVIRFNLMPSLSDERALSAQIRRAASELRSRRMKLLQVVGPFETYAARAGHSYTFIRRLRLLDLLRTRETTVDALRILKGDRDSPGYVLRDQGGKALIAEARKYATDLYRAVALGGAKSSKRRSSRA